MKKCTYLIAAAALFLAAACTPEANEPHIATTIQLAEGNWVAEAVEVEADVRAWPEGVEEKLKRSFRLMLEEDCRNEFALKFFADGSGQLRFTETYCGAANPEKVPMVLSWQANSDYTQLQLTGEGLSAVFAEFSETDLLNRLTQYQIEELSYEQMQLRQTVNFNADNSHLFPPDVLAYFKGINVTGELMLSMQFKKRK